MDYFRYRNLCKSASTSTTYTPSAADKSAGSVILTITSNDPGGPCPAVSDAMTVTFSPAATVNAGPDQSICAMATVTLAGSVGGTAASGTWSGGTGSYNPNANTLNAVYTPSAAERTAGSVTLTLTTNDPAGPCGAVSDNVVITIGAPLTTAPISGSGDACNGASSWFALNVNGGSPLFVVTYTLDGGANTVVSGYANGTHIDLGILGTGSHTVHIVSIRDACLNFVPTLPADYVFNINAIPNAGATVNNTPSLCSTGTTDIVLQSTVASSDFTWTVSNAPAVTWVNAPAGGTRVNGNNTSIAQVLAHSSNFPTTVTYTITPRGPLPTSCPGAAITRTVIVNPWDRLMIRLTRQDATEQPLLLLHSSQPGAEARLHIHGRTITQASALVPAVPAIYLPLRHEYRHSPCYCHNHGYTFI